MKTCILIDMGHIQLFVYFIVLLLAAVTSSKLLTNKRLSKFSYSNSFFYYYLSLEILVIGFIIANYRLVNVTVERGLVTHLIDILIKTATVGVIYTLPVFIISMFDIKKLQKILPFLRFVAITILLLNIMPYVFVIQSPIGIKLEIVSHHVQSIVLILIIIGALIFISKNYQNLKRKESRFILSSMLILALVFSPLFFVDMYRNELMKIIPYLPKDFWYTPLYLLFWSICILVINTKSNEKTANIMSTDNLSLLVEPFKLTKREIEVLSLIISGKTGTVIANELFVSESTIKKHTKSIYDKLDVKNKVSMIQKLNQLSLH